jgi:hypothetical protein
LAARDKPCARPTTSPSNGQTWTSGSWQQQKGARQLQQEEAAKSEQTDDGAGHQREASTTIRRWLKLLRSRPSRSALDCSFNSFWRLSLHWGPERAPCHPQLIASHRHLIKFIEFGRGRRRCRRRVSGRPPLFGRTSVRRDAKRPAADQENKPTADVPRSRRYSFPVGGFHLGRQPPRGCRRNRCRRCGCDSFAPSPAPSFGWQILASCEIQAAAVELATAAAQSVSRTSETTVAMATGHISSAPPPACRASAFRCGCFSS